MTWLCRVEQKLGIMKNGRIKSDNPETGAISKHGLDLEMIGIILDGCLNEDILQTLILMCMWSYLT